MRSLRAGAWFSVALFSFAPSAAAQSFEASASATSVQNHLFFANTRVEQTGQWFSAEGVVKVGRLRASMMSAIGTLGGEVDSLNPDRTGRSTSITAGMQATPWMFAGLNAEAKHFDSDLGISVWRLLGVNARFTPAVIPDVLEGLIDVTLWPSATIVEGDKMGLAFRTMFGATYRVRGGPVGVRLAYRFERFDFDGQGAAARFEQFRGATLGAVMRFGR